MADTKISALTDGGAIQTTDDIPVERALGNVRVQIGELGTLSDINSLTDDTAPIETSSAFIVQRDNGDYRKLELANLPDGIFPIDDTYSLVHDPVDNTKQVRFDVGGVATATTVVVTLDDDIDFTQVLTGTSGQKLGFDATPEAAVYSDRPVANINLYDATKPASFVTAFDGTVVACTGETDTGTVNIQVDIAGTNVTGLTAVALDSTIAGNRDTSSAANTFTKGQVITVTPSGASGSPTHILVAVELLQTSLPAALT